VRTAQRVDANGGLLSVSLLRPLDVLIGFLFIQLKTHVIISRNILLTAARRTILRARSAVFRERGVTKHRTARTAYTVRTALKYS